MADNMFSFNPFTSLQPGIPVLRDRIGPRGQLLPPHILCGEQFIQVEKTWQPNYVGGRLMNAALRWVDPITGRPFQVIDQKGVSTALYLSIDFTAPAGVKVKMSANDVNAFTQLIASDGVTVVMGDRMTAAAFLEFQKDGSSVQLWAPSGAIYRFRRHGLAIIEEKLSFAEMAALRVDKFNADINLLDLSNYDQVRRLHGIVGAAIRLLRASTDTAARNVLVDFLIEQIGPHMSDTIMVDIRRILLDFGHPKASWFLQGAGKMSLVESTSSSPRRKVSGKKAERAARDRALRQQMQGPRGQKQQPNSGKAKKGQQK